MTKNPRELLQEFRDGSRSLIKIYPDQVKSFYGMLGAVYTEGALSVKTKELISVALGVYNRCDYCIVHHVYEAFKAGATKEEIYEAALTTLIFGAGPSQAYITTILQDSVEEFAPDFDK